MTGFWSCVRGFSLTKESCIAVRVIAFSKSLRRSGRARAASSEHLPSLHQEVLHDGAERKGGEKRQGADDHDHADEQKGKERAGHRKGAGGGRDLLLGC